MRRMDMFDRKNGNFGPDDFDTDEVNTFPPLFDASEDVLRPDEKTFSTPEFPKDGPLRMYNPDIERKMRKILTVDLASRKARYWPLVEMTSKRSPLEDFPHLSLILNKYRGKLVLCGGAVANALFERHHNPDYSSRDADLFFYGISELEATEILTDCIGILCSADQLIGFDDDNIHVPKGSKPVFTRQVRIEKGLKYVNVSFTCYKKVDNYGWQQYYRVYQFVLRIYPTLDSILGGFDVPMCSFAWDGDKFWGTEIAKWCAESKILIANLSRRSPSFEYRLVKYCNRFGMKLCFPGLDPKFFNQNPAGVDYDQLRSDITATFAKQDVYILPYERSNNAKEWFDMLDLQVHPLYLKTRLHRISFHRSGYVQMTRNQHVGLREKNAEDMARISDYSHTQIGNGCIRAANSSACSVDNVDAVITCHAFTTTTSHEDATTTFIRLVEKPIVTTLNVESLQKRFHKHYAKSLNRLPSKENDIGVIITQRLLVTTGQPVWTESNENVEFGKYVTKHNKNAKLAAKNLKGLKWMTRNPDVQWTASYNPTHTTPKEYYGEFYRRFEVGIPREVSETILLARLRKGNGFSFLPNDVFKYLMIEVMLAYARE